MMYRAQITNVPRLPEILRQYQNHKIVHDQRNLYIEVDTIREAFFIEEINRLASKLQ